MNLRVKIALVVINIGIKIIPKSILSKTLLKNFIDIGWIKSE